jgi:hypothetical protein
MPGSADAPGPSVERMNHIASALVRERIADLHRELRLCRAPVGSHGAWKRTTR